MREARKPFTASGDRSSDNLESNSSVGVRRDGSRSAALELGRVTRALGALHCLRAMGRGLWANDAAREVGRVEPFGGTAPRAGVVLFNEGATP